MSHRLRKLIPGQTNAVACSPGLLDLDYELGNLWLHIYGKKPFAGTGADRRQAGVEWVL